MADDTRWEDVQRLEAWAGEVRVNFFRLAAVVAFYGHHLVQVFVTGGDDSLTGAYHMAVTILVLIWAATVVVLHVCLSRRFVPPALKYVATAWDLMLVTAVLAVGCDPKSMLTVLYFLVIGAAVLRLSLPLVYAATLGAMAAYLVYLGYLRFVLELPATERLSRPQQIIMVLALGGAGILAGQAVRQMRRIVSGYPIRVLDTAAQAPTPSA